MGTAEPTRVSRRVPVAGLGLMLAAALGVAATYTPLFAAGDIRVPASESLPRPEILALARVDGSSNVFHLDTDAVERRLERDPRILEARVRTALPDRVTIEIVPRTAVAVVGAPGALVGADGVVIGPADPATRLPALMTPAGRAPGAAALATAAATAGALGDPLRRTIEAIVVSSDGTLRLRLAAGFSATFGDASELDAKAASLAALVEWVREEGVTVVSADLTVPGSPTARLDRGSHAVPVP